MDYVKDFIYLSKTSGKQTIKSMKKNWPIIFSGLVYSTINLIAFRLLGILLVGPLYILSGIIFAIISSSLLSNYLYLLFNIINYDRFSFQDFKDGFLYFLRKIYGILFIGYLVNLLLSVFGPVLGNLSGVLGLVIYLGILILINALPETIYLKSYGSWDSIVYAMEFVQENFINWIIPNIIFLGLLYMVTGNILMNLLNTHLSFRFILNPFYILLYLIGQLIFSLMMIYRGHLYRILSTSTRRKRMFMGKF